MSLIIWLTFCPINRYVLIYSVDLFKLLILFSDRDDSDKKINIYFVLYIFMVFGGPYTR